MNKKDKKDYPKHILVIKIDSGEVPDLAKDDKGQPLRFNCMEEARAFAPELTQRVGVPHIQYIIRA